MNLYSKNKIYLIFASIGGFFFLFALLLLNQGFTMKRFSSEIQQRWMPSVIAANAIHIASGDYRAAEARHIISADASEKDQYEHAMEKLNDDIIGWQGKYEPIIQSPNERTLYQRFSKNYDSYLVATKQVLTLSQNKERDKAAQLFNHNTELFNALNDDLLKLISLNNTGSINAVEQVATTFTHTKIIIAVGTVLTLAIMVFFTLSLRKATINSTDPQQIAAVKTKIVTTFLTIMVFFLLYTGFFYQQIQAVNQKVVEINTSWMPSIMTANELNAKSSAYRLNESLHILSVSDAEMIAIESQLTEIAGEIVNIRKKYVPLISSKKEHSLYEDYSEAYLEYLSVSKQAIDASKANNLLKAAKLLSQSTVFFEDLAGLLEDLVHLNQEGCIEANDDIDGALQALKIITFSGCLLILQVLTIAARLMQSWILDEPLAENAQSPRTLFTIKTKLRLVFFGMVLTFAGFSLFTAHLMSEMDTQSRDVQDNWMPSIIDINEINAMKSAYRIAEQQHVLADTDEDMLQWSKATKRLSHKITKVRSDYMLLISSDEELELYRRFSQKYNDYMTASSKTLELSAKKDKPNAVLALKNSQATFDTLTSYLNKLVQVNSTGGTHAVQLSTRTFTEALQTMLSVVLTVFLLAILYMIIFDKNISVALQRLTQVLHGLSKGQMSQQDDSFKERADEIGQMANAISVVSETLQALTSDSIELIEAAQEGVLSARVDAARHPGEFGKIVSGMNSIIDALSKPLTEVAQIMQNLALGDLEGRMQGNYEGELRILKANVNRSLDALVSLLTELSQTLKYMANTDLTHSLTGNYQGAFSDLKVNTNQTIAEMITILQGITSSTTQAAAAITQTSESSKYVAKEASLQMQAVENVSKTITETAMSVNEIAQKARQGSQLACNTANFANDGQALLSKLIDLIQHIDAEYGKIEHITSEITRIADKTHLLSLNAGLEAMRAGEHGLAFGFVAQQIGQLAEEVSESAHNIGEVITSSGQKVRLGVHATQETQTAMAHISQAAQQNENTVQDISAAIVQQSAAVKSLSERVADIRLSSEATASAAEEISATMAHLAESVRETAAQAKRFKLVDLLAKVK